MIKYPFTNSLVLAAIGVTLWTSPQYWQGKKFYACQNSTPIQGGRSPSSFITPETISLNNYKSFFKYSSFQGLLKYDLAIEVRSENQEFNDEIKSNLKTYLWNLFSQTPDHISGKTGQNITKLKDNHFFSLIHQEVLSQVPDQDRVQIDLNFIPKVNTEDKLIPSTFISFTENKGLINQFKNAHLSNQKRIVKINTTNKDKAYHYEGGQISFFIQNTNSYMRIRKFLKVNELNKFKPFSVDQNLIITNVNLIKNENKDTSYVTSDTFLSLDNGVIKATHTEVHFDKLQRNDKIQYTGNLVLEGFVKTDKKQYPFVAELNKLIFNNNEKKFDDITGIKIKLSQSNLSFQDSGLIKNNIFQGLIKNNTFSLINNLKLNTIDEVYLK